jgi:hypothetical protein
MASNSCLKVFIASTSEGLKLARSVHQALTRPGFEPILWEKAFPESLTIVEGLEEAIDACDFAIVTATPDDLTLSRGKEQKSPRDNVIFELGFFMGRLGPIGRLGRLRTYLVINADDVLKRPSDLSGLMEARIIRKKGQSQAKAVTSSVDNLCRKMKEIGNREKRSEEDENEAQKKKDFCRRISGTWWEINSIDGKFYGLSLFDIKPKNGGTTVALEGWLVGPEGQIIANWYSIAVAVYPDDRRIFYLWEGSQNTAGGYLGVGRFDIQDSGSKLYQAGTGKFITVRDFDEPDVPLGSEVSKGSASRRWKQVKLRRADPAMNAKFNEIIHDGDDAARKRLVTQILHKYKVSSGLS